METDNRKQHPPDGEIGAVIPHEILSRTDAESAMDLPGKPCVTLSCSA